MLMQAISVNATGANITTGLTSASVAIPVTSSGTLPKYVMVTALTNNARVRLGGAGVTALATDLAVTTFQSVIIRVSGNTNIAAIQDTAAGVIAVVPLEDA